MAKILLDHADGRYSTQPLSEEKAAELEAQGEDVTHVEDRVYDAYLHHCGQDAGWQALWRSISNEHYLRRREQELLPLEEAQREIERLKNELARSERMHRYFEDEWLRATGRQPRAEHENDGAYTCIFPQPGCDIEILESDEWRASAAELLKKYNVSLGKEGSRYQGCCCGHTHRLLSTQTAEKLRAAGFLVENDSDPNDEFA
jgi:hypothetical protein